jgi:hypothetical protein
MDTNEHEGRGFTAEGAEGARGGKAVVVARKIFWFGGRTRYNRGFVRFSSRWREDCAPDGGAGFSNVICNWFLMRKGWKYLQAAGG